MINRKYFTLTEIMAVMTIIVIVLSIGVSGYRNITSQASLMIESNEVKSKLMKDLDFSIRSRTPTVHSVRMGKTQSEKSYLYGGRSSLLFSFDFDTTLADGNGTWKPEMGRNSYELEYSPSSINVKDRCFSSDYGMCGNLLDSSGFFVIKDSISVGNEPFAMYAECKIKVNPGAQSASEAKIIDIDQVQLVMNKSGFLYCKANTTSGSVEVPDATNDNLRVNVATGKWVKVGFSLVTHLDQIYIHLFVDGKVIDSYPKDPQTWEYTALFNNDSPKFGENFNGLIDDIRIFDAVKGGIWAADPKAGFLVTANGRHDDGSSGTSTVDSRTTGMLIDGYGRFVPLDAENPQGEDWDSDMIGFASSSIYGTLGPNSGFNWWHANRIFMVQGGKLSALPENGYLLFYYKNIGANRYYEVVQYSEFDGERMKVHRGLANTKKQSGGSRTNYVVRYLVPFIVDKTGGYR